MNGTSKRDPEWKQAFNKYLDREREFSKQRFPPVALSTVDLNGRPAVRMLSPRGFVGDGFLRISKDDHGQWTSDVLTFCTHAKSNKVQELVNTNDVQLAFWLPHVQVQVRCSGQAHLLFHPDNPNYSTLSLDIRHRIWPRDGTQAEEEEEEPQEKEEAHHSLDLDNSKVEIDAEFIREQAYLHHAPVLQAWYSWPAPGKIRSADPALYPMEIPKIEDPVAREKYEADARRNYVLVFVDVNKVDIVDLEQATRKLYKRRGDTSWTVTNINP
ncbi:hypothetical protein GQ54DRAFT_257028 [Martensiomyces pterosporus]|nr:hypothetical protein GQ54DRAFT_257028 [Martensiomyces pterosporus]